MSPMGVNIPENWFDVVRSCDLLDKILKRGRQAGRSFPIEQPTKFSSSAIQPQDRPKAPSAWTIPPSLLQSGAIQVDRVSDPQLLPSGEAGKSRSDVWERTGPRADPAPPMLTTPWVAVGSLRDFSMRANPPTTLSTPAARQLHPCAVEKLPDWPGLSGLQQYSSSNRAIRPGIIARLFRDASWAV